MSRSRCRPSSRAAGCNRAGKEVSSVAASLGGGKSIPSQVAPSIARMRSHPSLRSLVFGWSRCPSSSKMPLTSWATFELIWDASDGGMGCGGAAAKRRFLSSMRGRVRDIRRLSRVGVAGGGGGMFNVLTDGAVPEFMFVSGNDCDSALTPTLRSFSIEFPHLPHIHIAYRRSTLYSLNGASSPNISISHAN